MFLYDEQDKYLVNKYKWSTRTTGYVGSTTCRAHTGHDLFHRFILDAKSDEIIDHINQNKLDNRRSNLRKTTRTVNSLNVSIPQKRNKLGIRGISMNKKGYCARLVVNGKTILRKTYKTLDEAIQAYEKAKSEVLKHV